MRPAGPRSGRSRPRSSAGRCSPSLLFVVVPVLVARRPDRLTILVGVSVLALAFFAVPTRVHERYLFPLFALAAIPFAFSWRWRIFYIVASIATFLNMYAVLTTIYPDNPSISDWLGIGDAITSQAGVTVIALMNTAVFLWALVQFRPSARRAFAAELEHGREPDGWDAPPALEPVPAGVIAFDAEPEPGGAGLVGDGLAGHGPGGRRGRGRRRPRRHAAAPGAGVVRPPRLDRHRSDGLDAHADQRDADPARPVAPPVHRRTRPARPARPVDPDRARRVGDVPAHVPARRAGPDALRRGLPRPDRRGVPPGLALRPVPLHLRVDAPAPRQVRDGRRHRAVRRARHLGHEQPRDAGPRRGHRAPPSGPGLGDGEGRRSGVDGDRLVADGLRPPDPQAGGLLADRRRERDRLRRRRSRAVRGHRGGELAGARHDVVRRRSRAAARTSSRSSPSRSTTLDGPISRLATFDGGGSLAARSCAGDNITIVDPGTGKVTGAPWSPAPST